MTAPRPPREAGMALVMVLWVISLMTIMAGSFALSTQREAGILSHAHERSKALALAEGGVNYAMLMLSLPDPKKRWQADGTPYVWQVEGARVKIRIMDEGGKIDLNAAQELTLKTVFKLAGQNEELAAQLADAIMDWRDPDDLKRAHGAEAEDYLARRLQSPPQNRNFLIMDELRGVMGITPELYRKLESWFTLYTGEEGLNPAKAPKEILLPLMGGDVAALENYLQQRRLSAAAGGALASLPPVPGMAFGGSSDMAYTVSAVAEIQDQQGAGVLATIRRGPGADGAPFTVLRWKPTLLPAKSNP
ncbi:MAG: general secretion pathway protein GspK [Methylococcaceae bacterium]|nr:general secretion pathway protein GspK [Methylococcaceae bacterium]